MKVAVVAEYYPRRRDPVLGVWAHRQALAARDAGADPHVLVLERPIPPAGELKDPRRLAQSIRRYREEPKHDERDGIRTRLVRFVSGRRDTSYAAWENAARGPLAKALDEDPPEIVHAHYALPAGGAALSWARRHGVPLVVSVHGGDVLGPAVAEPAARQRIGSVLRSADVVMCNSHATLERSAKLAGSDANMRVVHLGADPPKHPKPRRENPTVATLGHLVARKRHADVLRAVRLARKRIPDLEWLVIGDGPEREALEELARRIGVAEHVTFAGQLEPEEALAELASCHLMALPSVDEAFGVAYVEALACGVPAIGALGEGGPEEIAALSRSMLMVPPGDAEALATVIADVLESHAELSALAAQARRGAARHFSWEACGKATVECYREALRSA